jgi:hypothetical protein
MSALVNTKFSISIIESLQESKICGKLYKKSLTSTFRYWRYRYFKLFSSREYYNKSNDDNIVSGVDFKILIYYENDKYIIGNDKKGIVIIYEDKLIVEKSSNGYSCVLKNVFKLNEDGQLYSKPCELHLKSGSSADEMSQWINALYEKNALTIPVVVEPSSIQSQFST